MLSPQKHVGVTTGAILIFQENNSPCDAEYPFGIAINIGTAYVQLTSFRSSLNDWKLLEVDGSRTIFSVITNPESTRA